MGLLSDKPILRSDGRNCKGSSDFVRHLLPDSYHIWNMALSDELHLSGSHISCKNSYHVRGLIFFDYPNLAPYNLSNLHAKPSCLTQKNNRMFVAISAYTQSCKKHEFDFYMPNDKTFSRRSHKLMTLDQHTEDDLFLFYYFFPSKSLHIFYCKMNCLVFLFYFVFLLRLYYTMNNKLSVFLILPGLYIRARNIFVLGGLLVAERNYCNIYIVLGNAFGEIYLSKGQNKTGHFCQGVH